MRLAERLTFAGETDPPMGSGPASLVRHVDVVLTPLSCPELGEIRVESEFVIGRSEQPFASCGNDLLKRLSRQHARVFRNEGLVYLVDSGSRNGTTLNRIEIARAHIQLSDGDEICFGGALSYRVQITPRAPADGRLTLTLRPKSGDSGLDPIVIANFPFLVSKTDVRFSHYDSKSEHGSHLGFLSRRHAYIDQEDGHPSIKDLRSSNGTFVNGRRLLEHAVPLQEGALVALGGDHFVYEVSITRKSVFEPAWSALEQPLECKPNPQLAVDRTRSVANPTAFLEAFCGTDGQKGDGAAGGSAAVVATAKEPAVRRIPRTRVLLLLSELASLLTGGGHSRRRWWWAAAVAGILSAGALIGYFRNASERDLKDAINRGEYARAADLASRLLANHPDDGELEARATEVALKANVPAWVQKIRAGDFDGAKNVLNGMSRLSVHDADLLPLIDELEWLGSFERFVRGRGGPDAPIRIYADAAGIENLIGRWNEDTGAHQRSLGRIASHVPEFGDWYGEALTHLRRLQSESSVYLPVIERLEASVATELDHERPDRLVPMLMETAQRYPGLGGLDSVRQDLASYVEIQREALEPTPGRLFALLRKVHFTTPPFEQSYRALIQNGRLPSAELIQQYDAATQAWKDGKPSEAFAGLEKMTGGTWGKEVAEELKRRRSVTAQFAALQQTRNTGVSVDQLLGFRESLDADEDAYYVSATEKDVNLQRENVVARAQIALNLARVSWQEYRNSGPIDASQRIETAISDRYRVEARSLIEASSHARQGFLIYSQIDASAAKQWAPLRDEIESEARQQRSRLHDLSNVLEPELLKTKLALLGDSNE